MAEELKSFIDKIQQEGVEAGQKKAKDIEARAVSEATSILAKARKDADRMVSDAKEKIARMEGSANTSLKQAGRDLMLTLRKEINATLERLVASHVHKALSGQEILDMVKSALKECHKNAACEIVIALKKEDMEKLEKGLINELRGELKKGLTLKSSDDIHGGFMISYDAGKSYYDFTDKAMAQYLSSSLKPALSRILDDVK